MWQDKLDTSKLKEDVTLEYKLSNPSYVKAKVRKSIETYNRKYRLKKESKKNEKMYLFLMLDSKDNINLMQQFEINYLKHKAKDISNALNLISSGITVKIIERQMNVKFSFIEWLIEEDMLNYLHNFKGKLSGNQRKVKKGSRIVETDNLLTEYMKHKLDIIGYIRDGNTVNHTLDEVGSIYNTREWTTFMTLVEAEGYDLRGSDKLEDIIMMKLEGYRDEEIEVELGFNGTVEEECKIIFKGMDFRFNINSIGDTTVKKYQGLRESIDFESKKQLIPNTLFGVIHKISECEGLELLEFLDTYIYFEGDLTMLFREYGG